MYRFSIAIAWALMQLLDASGDDTLSFNIHYAIRSCAVFIQLVHATSVFSRGYEESSMSIGNIENQFTHSVAHSYYYSRHYRCRKGCMFFRGGTLVEMFVCWGVRLLIVCRSFCKLHMVALGSKPLTSSTILSITLTRISELHPPDIYLELQTKPLLTPCNHYLLYNRLIVMCVSTFKSGALPDRETKCYLWANNQTKPKISSIKAEAYRKFILLHFGSNALL